MKIAVVTGASSGMGREFVRQISFFYRDLDEIWVIARRETRLDQLKNVSRTSIRIFAGDLLKKQVFKKYRKALKELCPDVRMLVNAAGFGKAGYFTDISAENKKCQTDMISLNCSALTKMIEITLPYLKKGSRIINIASAAAFCPQCGFAVYAASKAFVLNLSCALSEELRPRGIVVTAVCPGPVDTEFFKISGELKAPLKKMTLVNASPVVHKALNDSRKKKAISVYGTPMKAAFAGTKLIPHGLILRWERLFMKNK